MRALLFYLCTPSSSLPLGYLSFAIYPIIASLVIQVVNGHTAHKAFNVSVLTLAHIVLTYIPASYSGRLGYKSHPRDLLYRLKFYFILLSCFIQIPELSSISSRLFPSTYFPLNSLLIILQFCLVYAALVRNSLDSLSLKFLYSLQ
jgi:hypothetical protein